VLDAVRDYSANKPSFSYLGKLGAPTIRVWPGDTIYLTLRNRLPASNLTSNAVNIHFHGLDVSPNRPADDVLTMLAQPGQSLQYVVHIPRSQEPGLYWYHPHSHGEAYWQVTSGMSGAIIVEGLQRRLPLLENMRERLLIVRDRQVLANIMWIPWYARPRAAALERAAASRLGVEHLHAVDLDDDASGSPCRAERGSYVSVEGTDDGVIPIPPGERQLFRVLNASGGRVLDLEMPGESLGLVAIDGYPVGAYPGTPNTVWLSHIVIPPGGRAEFIATGLDHPFELRSRCYDSGSSGDPDPEIVVAQIRPIRQPDHFKGEGFHQVAVFKPDARATGRIRAHRLILLTKDSSGFFINGHRFSMASMKPLITAHAGTLEQWTIDNDTDEVHAFHIHQVHFVVTAVNNSAQSPLLWRDTTLVPPKHIVNGKFAPGRITILVSFGYALKATTFPVHCHMLDHEDGGMMALIRVD
jgi:suppressor of ftsI